MLSEFKTFDWIGMENESETPRFKAIFNMLRGRKSVLDVGCANGVLRRWIPEGASYLGVDLCREAFQGSDKDHPESFLVSSAESFSTGQKFDAIVFNEMLYYCDKPVEIVKRFIPMLSERGVVVCSIFQKRSRFGPRKLLRFILGKPASNLHCDRMVFGFAKNQFLLDDVRVSGHHVFGFTPIAFSGKNSIKIYWH